MGNPLIFKGKNLGKGILMLNTRIKRTRKTVAPKTIKKNGMYIHPGNKHRFKASTNVMKRIIADEITNWLSAPSREFFYTGSIDKNVERLHKHLSHTFKDFTWEKCSSQAKFDLYSIDAGVIVELKSVKVNTHKLLFNASIYPDKVHVKNAFTNHLIATTPMLKDNVNKVLDVLVVCVERTKDDLVYNHAIVDGSYWGITEQDYIDCNKLFSDMNKVRKSMFGVIANTTKNGLAKKLFNDEFDGDFKLRKLITVKSPVGNV